MKIEIKQLSIETTSKSSVMKNWATIILASLALITAIGITMLSNKTQESSHLKYEVSGHFKISNIK